MDSETLVDFLHGRDLGAHTGLFLLDELVTAIHGSSAHLRHVRALTRGGLQADCRAAELLDGWTDGFRQRWGAVGITVEIILDHRVHTRRVVLQGAAAAVEASAEWGLMVYMDNVANLLHEPAARQVRHTEFQAVSLSGAWLDPLQSSTCSEPPSDECAPPGALAAPPAGPHRRSPASSDIGDVAAPVAACGAHCAGRWRCPGAGTSSFTMAASCSSVRAASLCACRWCTASSGRSNARSAQGLGTAEVSGGGSPWRDVLIFAAVFLATAVPSSADSDLVPAPP